MNGFRRFIKGIRIIPEASDPSQTDEGNISVNSSDNLIKAYIQGALRQIITNSQVQTLTNKKLSDTTTTIVNASDPTKVVKFDSNGTASTATTIRASQTVDRTVDLPDANDMLVGRDTTDTLTNKSIDAATNTISNITDAEIAALAGIVYSKLNLLNSIVDADIAAAAAIAYSKLSLTNSIVDADIAALAAIAYTKLNLTNSIVDADINAAAAIVYSKLLLTNSIVDADIAAAAAIAYSKLNLTGSIVDADIAALAAIAYSKLNLTGNIVDADIAALAAISRAKIAATTPNRVVVNDGSGNLDDSTVTTTELDQLSGIGSPAVGESDVSTLTNKTFGDAITATQIATPSNPSAGFNKLYFKNDEQLYSLDSAGNETAISSGSTPASQADMEAATLTTVFVSPGRTQYHPGVCKSWIVFDADDGSPDALAFYNMDAVTDNGVGDFTNNFTNDFSTPNYCATFGGRGDSGADIKVVEQHDSPVRTVSANRIYTLNASGSPTDFPIVSCAYYGDQ